MSTGPSTLERLVGGLRGAAGGLGPGVTLDGPAWISCKGRLDVGRGSRIASHPVASHLVVARGAHLEIGERVVIGHGAAIAAHGAIRIGAGTRLAPFVSISDTDFHVAGSRDGRPVVTPVTIGRDVRIGTRVTVLRGTTIGDGARVEAGSVVSGTIRDGAVVAGVPALERRPDGAPVASVPLEDLPSVVGRALGTAARLTPATRAVEVPEWDSLGALRVLLALEEAYGVRLEQSGMAAARSVGDLVAMVRSVRERGGRH